jgi:hypothetical protein
LKLGIVVDLNRKRLLKKSTWIKNRLWEQVDRILAILDSASAQIVETYDKFGLEMIQATRKHLLSLKKTETDSDVFDQHVVKSNIDSLVGVAIPMNNQIGDGCIQAPVTTSDSSMLLPNETSHSIHTETTDNICIGSNGDVHEQLEPVEMSSSHQENETSSIDSQFNQSNDVNFRPMETQKRKRNDCDDEEDDVIDRPNRSDKKTKKTKTPVSIVQSTALDVTDQVLEYFQAKITICSDQIRKKIPPDADFFEACKIAKEALIKIIEM